MAIASEFPATPEREASAFAPLRHPVFRALWIATIVSNVGTWMQSVGAAWLMTSLAPSATMVALVQAATTLPTFLLALPGGALADVMDRRKVLLWAQAWMLAVAAALGVATMLGAMNAGSLLIFTFLLGAGAALNAPAWQAITPDLVSREEIPSAVALGSAGFNVSRAVGPALGGLLIAAAGPAFNFLLNAVSFLGVMIVVYRWRREAPESALPAERFLAAMRVGARYVLHAPALRAVLVRAFVFTTCATALWALLPLIARRELGLGPLGYGTLLGALGAGAVVGTLFLPKLRRRMSADALIAASTVTFAVVSVALAFLKSFALLCVIMLAGGAAWLVILSSLNGAAQMAIPAWVRARALSTYLLCFSGSMTLGSVLWGAVAERGGIPLALVCSAIGLVAGLLAMKRWPIPNAEGMNLMPSMHWPAPPVVREPLMEGPPVLVSVEYRIDPARAAEFRQAMRDVRNHRLRDGAIRWELFADTALPERFVETFVVESWVEHLRQHERITVSDHDIHERARSFHIGAEPPKVSHLIAERP